MTKHNLRVMSVPLAPELQRAMKAAQALEQAIDAELDRLLTPDARRQLAEAEADLERRILFGEGS